MFDFQLGNVSWLTCRTSVSSKCRCRHCHWCNIAHDLFHCCATFATFSTIFSIRSKTSLDFSWTIYSRLKKPKRKIKEFEISPFSFLCFTCIFFYFFVGCILLEARLVNWSFLVFHLLLTWHLYLQNLVKKPQLLSITFWMSCKNESVWT